MKSRLNSIFKSILKKKIYSDLFEYLDSSISIYTFTTKEREMNECDKSIFLMMHCILLFVQLITFITPQYTTVHLII